MTVEFPYTLEWDAPPKSPFQWGSGPYLIHGFLGPQESNPNGISIGSADFAGLTSVTDRQTNRPTDQQTDRQTTLLDQ